MERTLRTLLLLLLCSTAFSASAQTIPAMNPGAVPQSAKFGNGDIASFRRWVLDNVPFEADKFFVGQKLIGQVSFEVTKSGRVRNVEAHSQLSPMFVEMLTTTVFSSPEWSPALKDGKPVAQQIRMEVSALVMQDAQGGFYADDRTIYAQADEPPMFRSGGADSVVAWLGPRVGDKWPDGSKIDALVSLDFVVEKDGSVSNLRVGRVPFEWLATKIKEGFEQIPAFTPGKIEGAPVRTRASMKLVFGDADEQSKARAMQAIVLDDQDQPSLAEVTMPKFRNGGLDAFRRWVGQTLRYPVEALKEDIQGRVVLSFIIGKDGSVSNVRVLQSPSSLLADEAVRTVESSPAWKPGVQDGKPVRVKYMLPVDFRTSGVRKSGMPQSRQNPSEGMPFQLKPGIHNSAYRYKNTTVKVRNTCDEDVKKNSDASHR